MPARRLSTIWRYFGSALLGSNFGTFRGLLGNYDSHHPMALAKM
jgi:hypothetical protein